MRVSPPSEADAIRILFGIKERYEKFHEVSYTDEAITFSVAYSNRYLPDLYLPGRALEVLDRAGARVKLSQTSLSEEVTLVAPGNLSNCGPKIAIANHREECGSK